MFYTRKLHSYYFLTFADYLAEYDRIEERIAKLGKDLESDDDGIYYKHTAGTYWQPAESEITADGEDVENEIEDLKARLAELDTIPEDDLYVNEQVEAYA